MTDVMQCDEEFRSRVAENLSKLEVRSAGRPSEHRYAAVALTVAEEGYGAGLSGMPSFESWQSRAALILTRRSVRLKNHPGQWAIPGGRLDDGETPEETALRELREEIDLDLPADAIVGRLDDFVTRSGFVITPVILWGGGQLRLNRNPGEVESIHRIPVEEFLRDDAPMLEPSQASEHPVLRMPVGDSWIAAPTAAILYQFREVCVLGKQTRVAHFDQPPFAWQ